MAKNKTQKILKSLVYLALEKGFIIEIRNSKYHCVFNSKNRSKEEVFKKYKNTSKGHLHIYDKENNNICYYTFDVMNDSITASNGSQSQYYYEQAEFISMMNL